MVGQADPPPRGFGLFVDLSSYDTEAWRPRVFSDRNRIKIWELRQRGGSPGGMALK